MKTWLSCLIAALLGFAAAWVLGSWGQFDLVLGYVNGILLNIGLFILLPLVFFTLLSAVGSLRKDPPKLGKVFLVSFSWSLSSAFVLSALAAIAFVFVPSQFPAARGISFSSSVPLAESLKTDMKAALSRLNPLANNPFTNLFISPAWLMPVAFTAFIFGFAMKPDHDAIKPAYLAVDSIAEIMHRLSKMAAQASWVYAFFFSAYWFKALFASGLLETPLFIFFFLAAAGAAALIVIPLLFWLFTGFSGNPYAVLFRTLSVSLLGLFSGNMLFALPGSYHLARRNLGVKKPVVGFNMPFATFFTRGGTAMAGTICLCALCRRANIPLGFESALMIAACSVFCSLACSWNLGFETVFVTVFASSLMGIDLGGIDILILGLLPIVNGLGVFIDMILASMQAYIAAQGVCALDERVRYKSTL